MSEEYAPPASARRPATEPPATEPPATETPATDDLLAPTGADEAEANDAAAEETAPHSDGGSEAEPASDDERRAEGPRDSRRAFLALGWTLVVVVAVAAGLIFAGTLRIASELKSSTCIQRAQAAYAGSQGPGLTAQDEQFARFALGTSLKKCGR